MQVLSFKKTIGEIKLDFSSSWEGLKDDKIVREENFILFYKDISSCIETDQEFVDVLKSL